MGQRADPGSRLLWGAVAATFAGVLPLACLVRGARQGRWEDHHVGEREKRPTVILVILSSVLVGTALLAAAGAPRELLALLAAMIAGLMVTLVVTGFRIVISDGAPGLIGVVERSMGAALRQRCLIHRGRQDPQACAGRGLLGHCWQRRLSSGGARQTASVLTADDVLELPTAVATNCSTAEVTTTTARR